MLVRCEVLLRAVRQEMLLRAVRQEMVVRSKEPSTELDEQSKLFLWEQLQYGEQLLRILLLQESYMLYRVLRTLLRFSFQVFQRLNLLNTDYPRVEDYIGERIPLRNPLAR